MRVNFSNDLGMSNSGGAGQSHEIHVTETIEYAVVSDCCSRKANNEQGTAEFRNVALHHSIFNCYFDAIALSGGVMLP